jgi:MFS family permease
VLLYPVYALLFSDAGLSVWQISSLFVIWSVSSMALEVPSGAWADASSRRRLLVIGPLLTAAAFGLWVGCPSYWVFALGFLLWGLKSALTSGALEALVYDELQRLGATEEYSTLMGRGQAAGVLATALGTAAAAPVMALGGFAAVGLASVVACALTAMAAMTLPEHRIRRGHDGPGWAASLRAGLSEARRSRRVRSAVVVVALVVSVWGALDEYAPLLMAATGVAASTVPVLLLVIWAGAAVGGVLAGPAGRLGTRGLAVLIVTGAALLAVGALTGKPGVVLVGLAFGAFQLASVLADTRLQHSIGGEARATVTSLAGMSTDVATVFVYGSYAVLADIGGHGGAFAILALPYVAISLWLLATPSLTSSVVQGEGSGREPKEEHDATSSG